MNEEILLGILKELKEIRMENKKIKEESIRKEVRKKEILKTKDEEIENLKKIIAVLEEKHENLVEQLKERKVKENLVTQKKRPLIYLSSLGIESILNYMDPNKRILTSLHYDEFLEMEKRFPLRLDWLELSNYKIAVNDINYEFRDEQGKWSSSDPQYSIHKATGRISLNVMKTTQELFFYLFTGRRNFKVELFDTTTTPIRQSPDEKIDARNVLIDGHLHKRAFHYRHYVGSVDRLVILNLYHYDSLAAEWIETAKRLEMLERDQTELIEVLPNLRAEEIYVSLHDIFQCIDVIREWCRNESAKIGWKLFLVFDKKKEFATINEILNSNELREIGFVKVAEEIHRKPMDNNLEVMLTVREDYAHFSEEFLDNKNFDRYLSLEIVDS